MFSSTNVSKWLSRDWTVEIGFDHWVTKDLSFFLSLSLFLPGTQSNFKMKTALVIIVSDSPYGPATTIAQTLLSPAKCLLRKWQMFTELYFVINTKYFRYEANKVI